MEPIGYVIICEKDFDEQTPISAPLITSLEGAKAERARIEGYPGGTLRCFEKHILVQVYSKEPLDG